MAELKKLSRDEMIRELIDNEMVNSENLVDLCESLLLCGFSGYWEMTDEEIEEIYKDTFEENEE